MKVKIKKLHPNAIIPSYAKSGDAGMDLTAVSKERGFTAITYGTGLAIHIPEGYVGYVFPRSSISKKDLSLCNAVGVIDSGYRGEIMLKFKTLARVYKSYVVGDRIGQLIIMPVPKVEFEEVDSLEDSDRGDGGFGSTGA